MTIVADTNVLIAVALDEPEKGRLIEATAEADLAAPATLPYEVGNALSALVKRKRLTPEEAEAALDVIGRVPVELVDVDIGASLRLAADAGIYAYDAYVLQCAMDLKCPLLTLDRAMQRVATALSLELAEQS